MSPSLGWPPDSSWRSRIRAAAGRAGSARRGRAQTLEAPVHRVTAPEACAQGPGAPRPRAGAGPQHASGRRASRIQAWVLERLSTRPTGWGHLAGSAPASPWSCSQIGLLRQSGPGLPRPRRRRTRRTWRPPSWARLRLLTLNPAPTREAPPLLPPA